VKLTVAVTGPTGEIGRPLIRALEREPAVARIRGMARRPVAQSASVWAKTEYSQGDIRDRDDVARLAKGADVVAHLAFAKFGTAAQTREVNLSGSRNVFAAAVAAGASRIVYTSSVAAYGPDAGAVPLDEQTPARGSSDVVYSAQKAELERTLADSVAGSPVAAYTLRPCIVAGPDSLELVTRLPYVLAAEALPQVLRPLVARLPGAPQLPAFGVPMQLVHGDELAAALTAAVLGRGPAGVYNLAGAGEVTIGDLAAELGWRSVRLPRAGLDLFAETVSRVPRLGERLDWIQLLRAPLLMETAKARQELGWTPEHSAPETLRQTVAEARRRGLITNQAAAGRSPTEVTTPCSS
jgi:nucleoside-diphosphate-sugar epimerase